MSFVSEKGNENINLKNHIIDFSLIDPEVL